MKQKLILLIVFVGVFLAIGYSTGMRGVAQEGVGASSEQSGSARLSDEAIRHASIPNLFFGEPFGNYSVLDGGVAYYTESSKSPNGQTRSATATDYFTAIDTSVSFAHDDLDGDGDPDTAVIMLSRSGGTGTFYDLVVFRNENGQPLFVDRAMVGDRIVVQSLSIKNGIVTIDMLDHGPGEPLVSATFPKTLQFQLMNGKLTLMQLAQGDEVEVTGEQAAVAAVAKTSIAAKIEQLAPGTFTLSRTNSSVDDGLPHIYSRYYGSKKGYLVEVYLDREGECYQGKFTCLMTKLFSGEELKKMCTSYYDSVEECISTTTVATFDVNEKGIVGNFRMESAIRSDAQAREESLRAAGYY
ncbi:MAG: hypothetical protein V4674_03925 [Patescibacteria group bacterium]